MSEDTKDDFTPQPYQVELLKKGLKQNTIIFLPAGSGKTFIAMMILKRMSKDLKKTYHEGGKISIFIVNTVNLVEKCANYLSGHTSLKIGQFTGTGDQGCWMQSVWWEEYIKNQVLVMTPYIFCHIFTNSLIDFNRINLIVFDECIIRIAENPEIECFIQTFGNLKEPPRIIGLTSTLLNSDCKPQEILEQVKNLERTFNSTVATIDGLSEDIAFSTNPKERFEVYHKHTISDEEIHIKGLLEDLLSKINQMKDDPAPLYVLGKREENQATIKTELINFIDDCIHYLTTLGIYAAYKTIVSYGIQIERVRKRCEDLQIMILLNYAQTTFSYILVILRDYMNRYDESQQFFHYSSHKMFKLIEIINDCNVQLKTELCCIIFTDKPLTAKIINFVLDSLSRSNSKYSFIKSSYLVAFNNTGNRESLYTSKKNRQILKKFVDKKINVLITSNVLEEGVNLPKCSLVVNYDVPKDYQSYVQSKGRARCKDSFYYVMIQKDDMCNFNEQYSQYQSIAETLQAYLVRNSSNRTDNDKICDKIDIEPFITKSAEINLKTAIPILNAYCQSLQYDMYTMHTSDWCAQEINENNQKRYRVTLTLPIVCPISENIQGACMNTLETAKQAAAFEACKRLYQIGELNDDLSPQSKLLPIEEISFLFEHIPDEEPNAGTHLMWRLYNKCISDCLLGQIKSNTNYFLHVVELEPQYSPDPMDICECHMFDHYNSQLCYGILTPKPLPVLSSFPVYVTAGEIKVSVKCNVNLVSITEEDLMKIKEFQYALFKHILEIIGNKFVFDNGDATEVLLLVPVDKQRLNVNYEVLNNSYEPKTVRKLSDEEINNLDVTQETYLHKIVTPWYRREFTNYVVVEISMNTNSYSAFHNKDYSNFIDYFEYKHFLRIVRPELPLLLVKGLTKRLHFIKPKGKETKPKRYKCFEELTEHLPPELVIQHDFPSSLWIQGTLMPTILFRISFMLTLEQFRVEIAKEAGLGTMTIDHQPPLVMDKFLIDYQPNPEEEDMANEEECLDLDVCKVDLDASLNAPLSALQINVDFATKVLEAEYPWKDVEEPKDIERTLDVNRMDIEHFEKFINDQENSPKKFSPKNVASNKHLPLSFHKNFVHKALKLLEDKPLENGPTICDLYQALTTARANDIVNLEMFKFLGSSYLKLISTLYVIVRFDKFNVYRLIELRNKIINYKNLYYLADNKNLGGMVQSSQFSPKDEWLPPTFSVPKELLKRIENQEVSLRASMKLSLSPEEQITGYVNENTKKYILNIDYPVEIREEAFLACFLRKNFVADDFVADTALSLLGAYFYRCGFLGGIKFAEWMNILPSFDNFVASFHEFSIDPIINTKDDVEFYLTDVKSIEDTLGYTFNNKGFVLQALTHSSYTPNRLTLPYEKLRFIGNALLQFLLTCYIVEFCEHLSCEEQIELRWALVNINLFASLSVRYNLQKHLLVLNSKLQSHIDKFMEILRSKDYQITEEILYLLSEDELYNADCVDVPKVLGEIFESLAGAVYLDSAKDLNTVWEVFHKLMWKELENFSHDVPKNVVKKLHEIPGLELKFGKFEFADKKCLIPLQFLHDGNYKIVHGCGADVDMAKIAAAKLALRTLEL